MYGYFQRQKVKSQTRKLGHCKEIKTFKRESESLLIAAQNNAIRTYYIKARIDKTLENNRCRLYDDRDETINYIISECRKLAQNIRVNLVGKVFKWEFCMKLKFAVANRLRMPHTESVLDNKTLNILWDFEIQTNHIILERPLDIVIGKKIKKK